MPRRRHAELVQAVLTVLRARGCFAFPVKQMATPRRGRDGEVVYTRGQMLPGVPDVIACSPSGRFIAVECKVGKDRMRPAQVAAQSAITNRSALHIIARDTVAALLAAQL